jgi:glyoxylase-like metal-dependent hydrolase (beta-lactamase superfamily II)
MKIYKKVFSPIDVNTYIITGDDSACVVIDCGCYSKTEERGLVDLLSSLKLEPVLLNTHCHLDHIFGNAIMLEKYGLRSWFHQGEKYNHLTSPKIALMFGLTMELRLSLQDTWVRRRNLTSAGLDLEVITVPGHSPGGVAFYSRENGSSLPAMLSLQEALVVPICREATTSSFWTTSEQTFHPASRNSGLSGHGRDNYRRRNKE